MASIRSLTRENGALFKARNPPAAIDSPSIRSRLKHVTALAVSNAFQYHEIHHPASILSPSPCFFPSSFWPPIRSPRWRKFSVFGKIDLAALARGEIKTAAGPPMSTARYLSVAELFRCSKPARQGDRSDETIRSDGASRPEGLSPHRPAGDAVRREFFETQQSARQLRGEGAGSPRPRRCRPSCKSAAPKRKNIPPASRFSRFWIDLLTKRAQDFVAGGAAREAPYDHTSDPVQPGQELAELVTATRQGQPAVRRFPRPDGFDRRQGLAQTRSLLGTARGRGRRRAHSRCVLSSADGRRRRPDRRRPLLREWRLQCRRSRLYQLWPVDVDGRPSTLVWRGNFISAKSLAICTASSGLPPNRFCGRTS